MRIRWGERESSGLLFLRVFSSGKRSRDLFNQVSKYWRFTGRIHLISGPDLATTTIEPHEFLDYVTRKLARSFISNREELAKRLSEMDNQPDGDGRYRVNDFFCYNDTWKIVLLNLVNLSKVVLMECEKLLNAK
ncbi:MAG: hypothetical protein ACR2KZ_12355 [Segetibacter sp.]